MLWRAVIWLLWLVTKGQGAQLPNKGHSLQEGGQLALTAIDCENANEITSVKMADVCNIDKREKYLNQTIEATLLQKIESHLVTGFRCKKLETKIQAICGLFSHTKLYTPPQVLEPVQSSIEECSKALKNGILSLPDGSVRSVELNSKSYYKLVSVGNIWQSHTNVQCKGSVDNIDNKTVENIIEMISGQFSIEKIQIEIGEDYITDTDEKLKLPSICLNNLRNVACQTQTGTYLIPNLGNLCNFEKIRTLKFEKKSILTSEGQQDALINQEHKIFVALKNKEKTSENCGNLDLFNTNHRNLKIFLHGNLSDSEIKHLNMIDSVSPSNVDIDIEMSVLSEFDRYIGETNIYEHMYSLGKSLCTLNTMNLDKVIVSPFHENRLITVRGDILQEIHCKNVSVTARLGENRVNSCLLNWLPVWKGSTPAFLRAGTHLLVKDINELDKISCSAKFTAVFVTSNGSLLVADPEIQILNLTLQYSNELENEFLHVSDFKVPVHDTRTADLLYTDQEVTAYNDLLHFRHAKEQIITHLVGKYCHQSEDCGSYRPAVTSNFDLEELKEQLSPWTWVSGLLSKLQAAGSICSLIIVVYLVCVLMYKMWKLAFLMCGKRLDAKNAVKLAFFTDSVLIKAMLPTNEEVRGAVPTAKMEIPSAPEEMEILPTN